MPHAATLRRQIEDALQDRVPGALSPRPTGVRETIPTGIDALDAMLHGGLPIGALAELVGPESSGRTTAALSFLSRVTADGNVCAWIDVSDALDPETAAANGVDLERLLWVRCARGKTTPPHPQPEKVVPQTIASAQQPQVAPARPGPTAPGGCGSPHPRSEGRSMSEAIHQLLHQQPRSASIKDVRRNRGIGTPGAPNRPLTAKEDQKREEQIPTDRRPARRGENLQPLTTQQASILQMKASLSAVMAEKQAAMKAPAQKREFVKGEARWSPLDRALRATDLLLQAGGFRAIVLDLGSTPAEMAWRVPMATWFRFRAACERSRVSVLLLTQHPCARSSAELVVRMQPGQFEHTGAVMTGITWRSQVERQRKHRPEPQRKGNVVSIRKQPQTDPEGTWSASASWVRA
ncbi:RecA/RadA recombinase [Terriglobus roseus DSM 18391]|uniref:Protein RecA n=1 Tax=Terriglobus roseus (strain DSM 18391 / NRRL B-41598 / KBS 63) TaxID=926566 RepID=I3ZFG6_TERRK|nr:recombinase A [Terriglobus roseus]AFL87984.1 RecA/RadA recombinase [Terriglobus roseus DSM 18391]